MNINFTLSVDQRIKLYQAEAMFYEKLAKQAGNDDNSRRHWEDKANERWLKVRELKGA